MEDNIIENKDGHQIRPCAVEAPPTVQTPNPSDGNVKKKRRRGKTKRKIIKPFLKAPWQERRKNDKSKRNNRFRKIVVAKSRAPFNNNQFLMEIHKPEPENNFHMTQTPARTRDSSFSIDSEDNYFFSLPEDEEEYLTKEFSSVYEDAQSERLSNMSKTELIQEYLLLEAKYDNLVKRTERSKIKLVEDEKDGSDSDKDMSVTDKDSMLTDKDTSATSNESSTFYSMEPSLSEMMQRLKQQEDEICNLKVENDKLQHENEQLRQAAHGSTSEDSESDSSSSSDTCSSSSEDSSPVNRVEANNIPHNGNINGENGINGEVESVEYPLVNGFHSPKD